MNQPQDSVAPQAGNVKKTIGVVPVVIIAVVAVAFGAAGAYFAISADREPGVALPAQVATNEDAKDDTGGVTTPPVNGTSVVMGRQKCGPLVSPDGAWVLEETMTVDNNLSGGEDIVYGMREHRLIAKNLREKEDKILLTAKEYRSNGNDWDTPYNGEREFSDWTPCGWSQDGSKAYYVSKWAWSELGGNYPEGTYGGEKLMEVDVAVGGEKSVFALSERGIITGIRDAHMQRELVVYDFKDGNLYLSRIGDDHPTRLYETRGMDLGNSISRAVISPDGTKVALVTFVAPDPEYTYTVHVIDVATQNIRTIGTGQFLYWTDADTISIEVDGTAIEKDI